MRKHSWFFQNGMYYTILAIVVFIHLILLAVKFREYLQLTQAPQAPPTMDRPLKVKILDKDHWNPSRQIVQSEDPATSQKPKDHAFLGEKDRSFDRETVARVIDKFKTSSRGSPQGGEARKKSAPKSTAKSSGKKSMKDLKLSDLGAFQKEHDPFVAGVKEHKEQQKLGSKAGTSAGRGISSTNDHVENIPLGDTTYLNTVEYKYYGFFNRIRQRLEQFWGRSIQEQAEHLFKAGRNIASHEDLITALVVTLNEVGQVVSISIKGSSGIKELDDAAIQSFNEAGPFPNPPKGLIVDGKVEIEWGFVVNT